MFVVYVRRRVNEFSESQGCVQVGSLLWKHVVASLSSDRAALVTVEHIFQIVREGFVEF